MMSHHRTERRALYDSYAEHNSAHEVGSLQSQWDAAQDAAWAKTLIIDLGVLSEAQRKAERALVERLQLQAPASKSSSG